VAQSSHEERASQAAPATKARAPRVVVSAPKAHVKRDKKLEAQEGADKASAKRGAIFMAFVMVVYVLWIVLTGQFDEFVGALAGVDVRWLSVGMLCMVLYFVLGVASYVAAVITDRKNPVGLRDLASVEASGILYGYLTPMNSGAIPAQVYRLTKAGLTVGEASALQFTRSVIYQSGEVLVALLMLALKLDYFMATYGDIVYLALVAFAIQALQVAGLLVVCLCPRLVVRVGRWAIGFADRRGWLKNASRYYTLIETQVSQFSGSFRSAFRHKRSMGATLVITFFQLCFFYAVPYFVLLSFGHTASFLVCLAGGSMIQIVGDSVPLPGGAGGNEAGFALFFGSLFGASAAAGFIVWRVVTYFLPILCSLVLTQLRSTHHTSLRLRADAFMRRSHRGIAVKPGRGAVGAPTRAVPAPGGKGGAAGKAAAGKAAGAGKGAGAGKAAAGKPRVRK
jgi:hypothetical protein